MQTAVKTKKPRKQAVSGRFWAMRTYRGRIKDDHKIDPACGSGGFLLHALDYMRTQASEYYDAGTVDYFNYWHDFASKHLSLLKRSSLLLRRTVKHMLAPLH